jgi:hypothetical protein
MHQQPQSSGANRGGIQRVEISVFSAKTDGVSLSGTPARPQYELRLMRLQGISTESGMMRVFTELALLRTCIFIKNRPTTD